jgi:hypothetical protein
MIISTLIIMSFLEYLIFLNHNLVELYTKPNLSNSLTSQIFFCSIVSKTRFYNSLLGFWGFFILFFINRFMVLLRHNAPPPNIMTNANMRIPPA